MSKMEVNHVDKGSHGQNSLAFVDRWGSWGLSLFSVITSQRLLDQSQAGRQTYMGKMPHTPPFWPFWAYSRTLPQGVELLV